MGVEGVGVDRNRDRDGDVNIRLVKIGTETAIVTKVEIGNKAGIRFRMEAWTDSV